MINRTYNNNSKFWLDDEEYSNFQKNYSSNVKLSDIVDKIKILKTISNFVNIVTDESYPVNFAGNSSFSDGKSVTVTAGAKDFDAVCGLSLHEASHIKYSQELYKLMEQLQEDLNSSLPNVHITRLLDLIKKYNQRVAVTNYISYIHGLINILEDHRIDSITVSKFPGYAGYYKALNVDYRFNDESNHMLASQEFAQENFKSYQIQLFGYIIDNKFNRFLELRGSNDIIKLMGSTNDFIKKSATDIFNLSLDIFEVILQYVVKQKELESESNANSNSDSDENEKSNDSKQSKKSNKKDKNEEQSNADLDDQNESNSSDKKNDDSNEEDENESNTSNEDGNDESNDSNSNENSESDDTNSNESGNEASESNENSNNPGDETELNDDMESDNLDSNLDADTSEDLNESSKVQKNPKPSNKTNIEKELEDFFDEVENNPEFEKLIKIINNEYEKEEIESDVQDLINLVSNNIFKIKNTKVNNTTVQVAVISELNDTIIKYFPYIVGTWGKTSKFEHIKKGINLGKSLGNRLVLMNDKHKSTNTRKKSGNIDSRLLAEIGAKNYKIFNKTTTVEFEDQFVHITIDTSGSMEGDAIDSSLQLAATIATASTYLKGLRVQVSIRSTTRLFVNGDMNSAGNYLDVPYVAIIFDSKINNVNHILKYWPMIATPGATPEAVCFEAIMDIITESSKNRNSYFINICDGYPEFSYKGLHYGGDTATRHGKEVVKKLLSAGIKVMVYLVDGNDSIFNVIKSIYGNNNSHQINVDNISEISRTLNKSFFNK
jgi:hypothetical protein